MRTMILNPDLVDLVWDDIGPYINDAVAESCGELDAASIKQRLVNRASLALCALDEDTLLAVAILDKSIFPNGKKALCVTALGGTKVEDWVSTVDEAIVVIASEQECEEVRIVGRFGWSKMLRDLGWDKTHAIYSKRIGE